MRNRQYHIVNWLYTLLVAVAALCTVQATAGNQAPEDPAVPGEVIVRVNEPGALVDFLADFSAAYDNVAIARSLESRQIYLVQYTLGPGQTLLQVDAFLQSQMADGTLRWGELVYEGQAAEGKTDELWTAQVGVGSPQFNQQYARGLIGLDAAHQFTRGAGTVVAVLDTGIDAGHEALGGVVLTDFGWNAVTDSAEVTESLALPAQDTDNDGLFNEMVGHGTFVAGLVHLGAPDAKILPVTVLDSNGIGDSFTIIAGMYYAIDRGVEVINMSLGSTYRMQGVEEAVAEAQNLGIIVVGAAGNYGVDDPRENPATVDGAIGVAATNAADIKAPFSNYEKKLDLSAPGHSQTLAGQPNVYDVQKSIIGPVPDGGYAIWKGTSFSTPLVSAGAALIRAQHPQWPATATTAANIVNVLQNTSVDIYDKNPQYEDDQELGAGRIDLEAAAKSGPIAPGLGDLNGNGLVDGADLGLLLASWDQVHASADLDGSGIVDGADLGLMLSNWSE